MNIFITSIVYLKTSVNKICFNKIHQKSFVLIHQMKNFVINKIKLMFMILFINFALNKIFVFKTIYKLYNKDVKNQKFKRANKDIKL